MLLLYITLQSMNIGESVSDLIANHFQREVEQVSQQSYLPANKLMIHSYRLHDKGINSLLMPSILAAIQSNEETLGCEDAILRIRLSMISDPKDASILPKPNSTTCKPQIQAKTTSDKMDAPFSQKHRGPFYNSQSWTETQQEIAAVFTSYRGIGPSYVSLICVIGVINRGERHKREGVPLFIKSELGSAALDYPMYCGYVQTTTPLAKADIGQLVSSDGKLCVNTPTEKSSDRSFVCLERIDEGVLTNNDAQLG